MPGIPYLIYGTVTESSTAVPNATIKARNETTNELLSTTTDSNGLYIFDASDFTTGYNDGDQVTVYSIYTDFEGTETITIDLGTAAYTEQNLALTTVTDNNTISYCTVQDVYDELDGKTSTDISTERIVKSIQRAEALIELKTNTSFKVTTVTNEVHTGDRYSLDVSPDYLDTLSVRQNTRRDGLMNITNNRVKTDYHPIISVTSLSINMAGNNAADSWSALTQQTGSGGDYYLEDSGAGIIDFITTYPRTGKRSWKVSYTYGYDPDSTDRHVIAMRRVVARLTILLACKSVITTKSTGAIFDTTRDIKIGAIELRGGALSSSQYLKSVEPEIQELWRELGELGLEIV